MSDLSIFQAKREKLRQMYLETSGTRSGAGNAAGTGARIALLNENARDEIEQTVSRIEKIETATEPLFQKKLEQPVACSGLPENQNAIFQTKTTFSTPVGRSGIPEN